MKISLEEAFRQLREDDDNNSVTTEQSEIDPRDKEDAQYLKDIEDIQNDIKTFYSDKDKMARLGREKQSIPERHLLDDLWDQVYCSLTDAFDNQVDLILGEWSGKKHYKASHVMPSSAQPAFLPKGFRKKGGYNDIIVFSPYLNLPLNDLLDDDDNLSLTQLGKMRDKDNQKIFTVEDIQLIADALKEKHLTTIRGMQADKLAGLKKNGKNLTADKINKVLEKKPRIGEKDFEYAKKVAEAYHLPYLELEDAFVLYVPKTKFLDARMLDEEEFLQLFPMYYIKAQLNKTNEKDDIDSDIDFLEQQFVYDIKPYFDKYARKTREIKSEEEAQEVKKAVELAKDAVENAEQSDEGLPRNSGGTRIHKLILDLDDIENDPKYKDKIDFIKQYPDILNWVNDTVDEMFYEKFGIKSGDNAYTEKEERMFKTLSKLALKLVIDMLDEDIRAYKDYNRKLQKLPEKIADLEKKLKERNDQLDLEIADTDDVEKKATLTKHKIEVPSFRSLDDEPDEIDYSEEDMEEE